MPAAPEFSLTYQRRAFFVYAYLQRRVQNPTVAEDLAQETWLRAWAAWDRYRPLNTGGIDTWLISIAHNLWVDWQRRDHRQAAAIARLTVFHPTSASAAAPRLVETQEGLHALRVLLQTQTPQRRAVLQLTAAGYTDGEISQRLGITLAAVKSSRLQARRSLIRQLVPLERGGSDETYDCTTRAARAE